MVDVLAEELVGLDAVGVGPDAGHEADLDVGERLGGRVRAQEGAVVAEGRGEDAPAAERPLGQGEGRDDVRVGREGLDLGEAVAQQRRLVGDDDGPVVLGSNSVHIKNTGTKIFMRESCKKLQQKI